VTLSRRELEVLEQMACGLTATEDGAARHYSWNTIRWHRARIRRKLGARNNAHAVAIGFRTGLLR